MVTRRAAFCGTAVLVGAGLVSRRLRAAQSKAKHYFKIVDVTTGKDIESSSADLARDLLDKELRGRPEFSADLGGVTDDAAVVAELKKRGLVGFRVSLRLDKVARAPKPPRPGGRLKQLAVDVKLTVIGATLPGDKLAFRGDGEAAMEAEVVESRAGAETASMIKEVMTQAVKQAVDHAVMRLTAPKSTPFTETGRKRREGRKK